jgi:DUF971 family protein
LSEKSVLADPVSDSTQPVRPVRIKLDAGNDSLAVAWSDGHESRYAYSTLRSQCPCATCLGKETESAAPTSAAPFAMFKKAVRPERVEVVGRYALQVFWNDGHSTGIYTFTYLRGLCPCAECEAERR